MLVFLFSHFFRALTCYLRFLYSVRSYSRIDASVADIFRERVLKKNPNKVLFVFEDKEWTAAQVSCGFLDDIYCRKFDVLGDR